MSRVCSRALTTTLCSLGSLFCGAQTVPTVSGDCDGDWSVDSAEVAVFAQCSAGSESSLPPGCQCVDFNADAQVNLLDFAELQTLFTGTQFLSVDLGSDMDDGTEVRHVTWHADGFGQTNRNLMGAADKLSYLLGVRFRLPDVDQNDRFVYARLVLPGTGDGVITSGVLLRVVGADQDSVAPFHVVPPSYLPKTSTSTPWDVPANWPEPNAELTCMPLRRFSPDIAPIINEIVARPGWGSGDYGKTLALVVEDRGSGGVNYVACSDYRDLAPSCPGVVAQPVLELYRTVRSTFIGKELLTRPTDHSVAIHALSLLSLEAYVEAGVVPGEPALETPVWLYPAETPIAITLDGLAPDTQYFYRLRYRMPGQRTFETGPERTFRTARPAGSVFSFVVQADSHVQSLTVPGLYRLALENQLADGPDFHIDLGDTFNSELYTGRNALDFEEAVQRHLDQRALLDRLSHSTPLYIALGNHEGEQGWRLNGTADSLAVWAANARKSTFPLPVPDGFYSGNATPAEFVGLRENYYAWQWGDALFVVLDPFWYTMRKPHGVGTTPGSGDNWDWTLGREQYDWLRDTLEGSPATFKFVFTHHLTGGVNTYGRGGIEAASHALGGCGSFEWGGEDPTGEYVFDEKRPGWGRPIHQLLADTGVTILFHAHDHVFVRQELDGVIYQACPQPGDSTYSQGFYLQGGYAAGDKVNNTGHLRVTVAPESVSVSYIRAYLPGDGPNGEIAYTYTLAPYTHR